MMRFDRFEKEDFALLLEGFNTDFLQIPLRRPAPSFVKFIPKGFRPEKLTRSQMCKAYIEAMYAQEPTISEFIKMELQQNFERTGMDAYMSETQGQEKSVSTQIIEISRLIFVSHLILPAHLVLMLYGIDCTPEEKRISEELHAAFQAQRNEAREEGMLEGCSKSDAKFANELEAERKKVLKLQKNLEAVSADRNEHRTEKNPPDYQRLLAEVGRKEKRIQELENSLQEKENECAAVRESEERQRETAVGLSEKLTRTEAELHETQEQVAVLAQKANAKESFSPEEIKAICREAIQMFRAQHSGREAILEQAKSRFAEQEDVKTAWQNLCDASVAQISELFDLLAEERFTVSDFEKFTEIENLLLLESAIRQALCSVAHRVMASVAETESMTEKFTVQE